MKRPIALGFGKDLHAGSPTTNASSCTTPTSLLDTVEAPRLVCASARALVPAAQAASSRACPVRKKKKKSESPIDLDRSMPKSHT